MAASGVVLVGEGAPLAWGAVASFLSASGLTDPACLTFLAAPPPATQQQQQQQQQASCRAALLSTPESGPAAARDALAAAARCLSPGGQVFVFDAQRDAARQEGISKELTLAGFTDASVDAVDGVVLVKAVKPAFQLGTKQALRKKAKPAAAAWAAADGDDALMDDETLLTEEDKQPATRPADDCEVGGGGKKACKNCRCGRADAEAQGVKLSQEMLDNPQSACGSVSVGKGGGDVYPKSECGHCHDPHTCVFIRTAMTPTHVRSSTLP